jgi:hypothetical protein
MQVSGSWLLATGYWQLNPCFLPRARSEKPAAKMLSLKIDLIA